MGSEILVKPFKNFIWGLFAALFIFGLAMIAVTAHAQDAVAAVNDPTGGSWLTAILDGIVKIFPKFGPILSTIVKWVVSVGGLLTVVAAFLDGVCIALRGALNVVGLEKAAAWVKRASEWVMPWIKYLSMYNVKALAPPPAPAAKLEVK